MEYLMVVALVFVRFHLVPFRGLNYDAVEHPVVVEIVKVFQDYW